MRCLSRLQFWSASLLLTIWLPAGADQQRIEVVIVGVEGEVLSNVRSYLSIAQLQPKTGILSQISSIGQEEEPTRITERLIRRLHQRAPVEIRQAMQPFGYYQPEIQAKLTKAKANWRAEYVIDPGLQTVLERVEISVEGAGSEDAAFESVRASLTLRPGDELLHSRYTEAKTALLKTAFNHGYLAAKYRRSEIRVHPQRQRADIHLILDSGPRYHFGQVSVQQDILKPEFAERFIKIRPGDRFDPDRLLALQARLSDSGYFSRVEIQARREDAVDYRIPVTVKAEPRKPRTYALGAGYATDTGLRATAGVRFRRINRHGHKLLLDSRVSRVKDEISAQYEIPIANIPKDSLVFRAAASREDIDKGDASKKTLGVSYNQGWLGAQWRLYADLSQEDYSLADGDDKVTFLTPGINLSRLRSDDLLFPRKGYSWDLDLRGANDAALSDVSYLRSTVEGRLTLPLLKRARLLLRGRLGAINTERKGDVPATERFYAGGDQSVRGYGYNKLGPTEDGENVGGRYLTVGSVEADYLFAGNFGAAAFFDAGNADDDFPPDLKRGVGIGFRWRSPVGMARIDLAKALDEGEDFRIHISFGADL